MSALAQVFEFETNPIRTAVIDGDPWFVAADICDVLGLSNRRSSLALLDDDEKGVHSMDTPGGQQEFIIVNEPGMYSLILRSRRPEAKKFKRWITHDVLPAIRKTGRYEVAVPAQRLPASYAEALRELASTVEERDAAQAALEVAKPAADAWAALASVDGDYAVADAAKMLSRDPMIVIGRDRLFRRLEAWGWIYRQEIDQRFRVMQTAVDTGRMSEIAQSHYHPRTGELVLDPPQVRVSVKGLKDIRQRLLAEAQVPAVAR